MTRRDPRRPTVQAKPIDDDPHAGQLAVVVAFRINLHDDPEVWRYRIEMLTGRLG